MLSFKIIGYVSEDMSFILLHMQCVLSPEGYIICPNSFKYDMFWMYIRTEPKKLNSFCVCLQTQSCTQLFRPSITATNKGKADRQNRISGF